MLKTQICVTRLQCVNGNGTGHEVWNSDDDIFRDLCICHLHLLAVSSVTGYYNVYICESITSYCLFTGCTKLLNDAQFGCNVLFVGLKIIRYGKGGCFTDYFQFQSTSLLPQHKSKFEGSSAGHTKFVNCVFIFLDMFWCTLLACISLTQWICSELSVWQIFECELTGNSYWCS